MTIKITKMPGHRVTTPKRAPKGNFNNRAGFFAPLAGIAADRPQTIIDAAGSPRMKQRDQTAIGAAKNTTRGGSVKQVKGRTRSIKPRG